MKKFLDKLADWFLTAFYGPEAQVSDLCPENAARVLCSLQRGRCPDCGGTEFYEGDNVVAGQDRIKCATELCGSEFAVAIWPAPVFIAERTSEPSPDAQRAA